MAGALSDAYAELREEQKIERKYQSIDSYNRESKIEALQDVNLDPHQIINPTDALAQSLNRWKTVAATSKGYTPEQQQQIASNYYDSEIQPFYAKLGNPNILPKAAWMANAFNEKGALSFQVENLYRGGFDTGLFRGLSSTAQQLEGLGGTALNMIGLAVHTGQSLLRKAEIAATGNKGVQRDFSSAYDWHNQLLAAQAADDKITTGKGFFDRASAVTESYAKTDKSWGGAENPLQTLAADARLLRHYSNQDEFWSHVIPAKGAMDTATSMVTEMVATLPLFEALKFGVERAGGETLTSLLSKTPGGKRVASALLQGGEGLAYGLLTRPNDEKHEAWKDALMFATLGTIFHFNGKSMTQEDALKESGDAEALAEHQEAKTNAGLSSEKGVHIATPDERRAAYVEEHASNISVMGTAGQMNLYSNAANLIKSEERAGLNADEIKEHHAAKLEADKVSASPLLSAYSFIKDVLNGRKLTELQPQEIEDLRNHISNLVSEAEENLNRKAKPVIDANAEHGAPDMTKPGTKLTMDTFRKKAQKEAEATGHAENIKPEHIEARATQLYKKAQAKAAALSEAKRMHDPHEEAMEAAEVRTASDNANKKAVKGRKSGQLTDAPSKATTKTASKNGAWGLPANASASHNTEHIAYLRAAAPSLKPGELAAFYKDMDSVDFEKELETYFYPSDLKKAGVFFEYDVNREGRQNPNFLAFMYNYKNQMPLETAQHLVEELENSQRFEKHFKKTGFTDVQMRHFALQMYNHVQTFVHSTSFILEGERNVFRSTQSNLLNPTLYQHQLLDEMHSQNLKLISSMFPNNARAKTAARTTYKQFAQLVDAAFVDKPDLRSTIHYRAKVGQANQLVKTLNKTKAEQPIPLPNWRF